MPASALYAGALKPWPKVSFRKSRCCARRSSQFLGLCSSLEIHSIDEMKYDFDEIKINYF